MRVERENISHERLKAGVLDLISAWELVGYRLGDTTPPSSQCMREAVTLPSSIEDREQLTRAIANDAATYVAAASQHACALAALLGSEIVLTGWTLTRSLAEYCGRVTWLLGDVTPTGRVARFYMERIVSLHMARLSADQIGNRKRAKELKREREKQLGQARRIFPDIKLFEVEKLNNWAVGGEPYAGLGKAVNGLAEGHLGVSGLYDTLSTFTHPSLRRLRSQMAVTQLEDRVQYKFTMHPEMLRWQMAVATSGFYTAAHYVVDYLQIDDAPLARWADGYPELRG